MGEYAAKFQPGIELDEFERRLRAAAPAPQPSSVRPDPLAELARLVGGEGAAKREDPFEALFRAQSAISDLRKEQSQHAPLHAPHEPYFSEEQHFHPEPAADDRQGASGEQQHFAEAPSYHGSEEDWPQEAAMGGADQSQWAGQYDQAAQAQAAPAGRRRSVYAIAALLLAGVAAIGGTLMMRAKSGPHEVVTIQADSDPARIKPEQADNSASANGQALFDRNKDGNVAKLVSKSEQPADLGETVKAARVVGPASSIPTPPTPVAATPAVASQGDAIFPTPKRVRTVSVRADGSLVDGPGSKPQQPARGLPSLAAMPAPTGGAIAPVSAKPAPAVKSAERVVNPVGAGSPPAPKPVVAKPVVAKPAAVKPVAVAKLPADAEEEQVGGETGVYAVQLAGSPVESEARAAANSLGAKYASALKGRLPTFVEAKVGEKTIYRVRVGHLTQAAATAMCSAIKGQGGNCFVAK